MALACTTIKTFMICTSILLLGLQAQGYDTKKPDLTAGEQLPELQGLKVTEKLGEKIDLSLEFTNELGEKIPLKNYFDGHKPVLLTIVYYGCPGLCNFHLNGLGDVLKTLDLKSGRDFQFVAVSMNHREDSVLASKKKENMIKAFARVDGGKGWHFLVGSEKNVKALADAVGFQFRWIESQGQYAHPAVAYILTPDGKISRYMHGVEFSSPTLRLSFVEASEGKVGSLLDQFMLLCFQFDPNKSKYTITAFNLMRIAGIFIILILAVILIPVWRRELKS